jgi:hypothetical protein
MVSFSLLKHLRRLMLKIARPISQRRRSDSWRMIWTSRLKQTAIEKWNKIMQSRKKPFLKMNITKKEAYLIRVYHL